MDECRVGDGQTKYRCCCAPGSWRQGFRRLAVFLLLRPRQDRFCSGFPEALQTIDRSKRPHPSIRPSLGASFGRRKEKKRMSARRSRRVDRTLLRDTRDFLRDLKQQVLNPSEPSQGREAIQRDLSFLEKVDPKQVVDGLRSRHRVYVRKTYASLTNQVRNTLDHMLQELRSQLELELHQNDGRHMEDDTEEAGDFERALAAELGAPSSSSPRAVKLEKQQPLRQDASPTIIVGDQNSINSAMRNLYSQKPKQSIPAAPPASSQSTLSPSAASDPVTQWLQQSDNSSGRVASSLRNLPNGGSKPKSGSNDDRADIPSPGASTSMAPGGSGGGGGIHTSVQPQVNTRKRRRPQKRSSLLSGNGRSKRQAGQDLQPIYPLDSEENPSQILYPTTTYADLGGIDHIIQLIRERIEHPFSHPEIYTHLGVQPPRGVLLHGPSGCGKTTLAHAIAGELKVPLVRINAPEIVGGMSGQSESALRRVFEDARKVAPCLLFIDEIDAIAPKRASAQREMERRIVAQLLTCMDGLSVRHSKTNSVSGAGKEGEGEVDEMRMESGGGGGGDTLDDTPDQDAFVMVVAATSRPDSLDPALRVAGRFDREIPLGIPDTKGRGKILRVLSRNMRLSRDCDLEEIVRNTGGYVGSDLAALTREAAVAAINRIFREIPPSLLSQRPALVEHLTVMKTEREEKDDGDGDEDDRMQSDEEGTVTEEPRGFQVRESTETTELKDRITASSFLTAYDAPLTPEQMKDFYVTMDDFREALKHVQPAAKREGFATKPDVSWSDIGALEKLKEELTLVILEPIRTPELFERLGMSVPAGVLLYGPPGCGKTLIAKAVAHESGASFLSVKGPELLNQYVGQSEKAVRSVFRRAQSSAPCIIFFDELDALAPKRGSGGGGGSNVTERVVNQLLTEMDGMTARRDVFVIAATNRPDIIDPAMLRPGRLEKLIYVELPNAEGRLAILQKHVRRTPLGKDVSLAEIANSPQAEGFSGADCAALVREATLGALKEAQAVFREQAAREGWPGLEQQRRMRNLEVRVEQRHFLRAFDKTFPSVSERSRRRYDRMPRSLSRARAAPENEHEASSSPSSASPVPVGVRNSMDTAP